MTTTTSAGRRRPRAAPWIATRGIREFVVGTGGKNHYPLGSPPANVEAVQR